MKTPRLIALLFILCLIAFPAASYHFHSCEYLNYITHGTFYKVGDDCWQFIDDLGDSFEIVNKGSWKDGKTGTIYAMTVDEGNCGLGLPLQICDWDADYSKNVVGTLVFLNFIECPGYYIRTAGETYKQDYYITNCEDFDNDLCKPSNLGRKIKAEVLVDTGVTICLGKKVSTVIDYDFLPQQ